jgi:hypothetical protein
MSRFVSLDILAQLRRIAPANDQPAVAQERHAPRESHVALKEREERASDPRVRAART